MMNVLPVYTVCGVSVTLVRLSDMDSHPNLSCFGGYGVSHFQRVITFSVRLNKCVKLFAFYGAVARISYRSIFAQRVSSASDNDRAVIAGRCFQLDVLLFPKDKVSL